MSGKEYNKLYCYLCGESLSLRKEFNELIVGLFFCVFRKLLIILNCIVLLGWVCWFLCKFASGKI